MTSRSTSRAKAGTKGVARAEREAQIVEAATRDLMAMDFGLGAYDDDTCAEVFALLRPLRIAAGDFVEE